MNAHEPRELFPLVPPVAEILSQRTNVEARVAVDRFGDRMAAADGAEWLADQLEAGNFATVGEAMEAHFLDVDGAQ